MPAGRVAAAQMPSGTIPTIGSIPIMSVPIIVDS